MEQISALQGAMLVVNIILPSAILFLPSLAASQAGVDAWLAALVAMLAAMSIAYIYTALSARFPGMSLIEFAPTAIGWLPGKIIGMLYLWWLLHSSAIIIREFAEFMIVSIMPQTPMIVFSLVMLILCGYGVRHGIEVLARANEVILVTMVVSVLGLILLVLNKFQVTNLMPILAEGIMPVLKGAYAPSSWMGEGVIATIMVIPFLRSPKQARMVVMSGLAFTGLLLTLGTLMTLAIVGPHLTITSKLPMLILSRNIDVGNFVERMEPVFIAIWVSGNFVKLSIFYYAFVRGSAQWLGLKEYRPLVLPTLTLIAPLSYLLFANTSEMTSFLAHTVPLYHILPFELGLPLLMLAVATLRGARKSVGRT
jgi:spore germination protein KB